MIIVSEKQLIANTPYKYAFDNLYWQVAGIDHATGEKTKLMSNFEEKYRDDFIGFMKEYNSVNLWTKFKTLPKEDRDNLDLINSMRHYDHTVNVKWVMHHLNAASKYLKSSGEAVEATGGSEWQKYMHPRYQRRIFFPELWTETELENWGIDNLEEHEDLTEAGMIRL